MVPMNEMIIKIFIIAFLVESIVLHEMAHGFVALLFGDQTAKRQGRITFNPIAHIDPLWTIAIPIIAYFLSNGTFIIGGAKPVPVDPRNYRRPVLGDICVSVAGVAVNFLIAVIMILLLNLVHIVSGNLTGSADRLRAGARCAPEHRAGDVQPDSHPAARRQPSFQIPAAPGTASAVMRSSAAPAPVSSF